MIQKKKSDFKSYEDYILYHRAGVIETWENKLKPIIEKDYPDIIDIVDKFLEYHDESKLASTVEWVGYSSYFLNPVAHPKTTDEYKKAWNHHQKTNPHHWQYWVLMEDECDPKVNPLEMSLPFVFEMLCNWASASHFYGNTTHWWYETQKDNMQLHPNTRKLIEHYLQYLD